MRDSTPSAASPAAQPVAQQPVSQPSVVHQPVPTQSTVKPEPIEFSSSHNVSGSPAYVISAVTGNPQIGPYVPYDVSPVAPRPVPVQLDAEQVKLTPEMLPGLWSKLFESEQWMSGLLEDERDELKHLLHGKEVEFEDEETFSIIADNSYYQTRIRPYVVHMLDELRRVSGIESLNCFCKVHYNQTDAVPYSAKEKYEAMLLINTDLLKFRQMFDEIDL